MSWGLEWPLNVMDTCFPFSSFLLCLSNWSEWRASAIFRAEAAAGAKWWSNRAFISTSWVTFPMVDKTKWRFGPALHQVVPLCLCIYEWVNEGMHGGTFFFFVLFFFFSKSMFNGLWVCMCMCVCEERKRKFEINVKREKAYASITWIEIRADNKKNFGWIANIYSV